LCSKFGSGVIAAGCRTTRHIACRSLTALRGQHRRGEA
jgi:hypothetical protein